MRLHLVHDIDTSVSLVYSDFVAVRTRSLLRRADGDAVLTAGETFAKLTGIVGPGAVASLSLRSHAFAGKVTVESGEGAWGFGYVDLELAGVLIWTEYGGGLPKGNWREEAAVAWASYMALNNITSATHTKKTTLDGVDTGYAEWADTEANPVIKLLKAVEAMGVEIVF